MYSFIDTKPIKCSKCGSTNAVRPVNDFTVEIKCGDCGHYKLMPEAQHQKNVREHPEWFQSHVYEKQDPTF